MAERLFSPAASGVPAAAVRVRTPYIICSLAFLAGISGGVIIQGVGELFGSEVVLPLVALGVLFMPRADGVGFRGTTALLGCLTVAMLFGFVLADIIAHTDPANYLRGWARVVAILSSFLSLAVIVAKSRRALLWYIVGAGLGEAIRFWNEGWLLTTTGAWKLGYGDAVISALAAAMPPLSSWAAWLSFALTGVYSLLHDSRNLGTVALAAIGFSWFARRRARGARAAALLLPSLVLGSLAAVTYFLVQLSANDFAQRQTVSDIGRFAALRVGVHAIIDNPILGFGSWGTGTERYAAEFFDLTRGALIEQGEQNIELGYGFLAHSQVIEAWMEGGIFAGIFFLTYMALIVRSLQFVLLRRPFDSYTITWSWFLLIGLWHSVMSPFLGSQRISITIVMAVLVVVSGERAEVEAAARTAPAAPEDASSAPLGQRRRFANVLR